MSQGMSHERLVAARKVKSSELDELYKQNEPPCPPLHFGKYKDQKITLYELALLDIEYFYFCYSHGYFHDWHEVYARRIAEKLKHIVPPCKRPDDWRFEYLFDTYDQLKRVKLVKKSSPQPEATLRTKHLDMTLGTARGGNKKKALRKITKLIFAEYFDTDEPSKAECAEFFENEKHFDLRCRENHCPKVKRGRVEPVSRYAGMQHGHSRR